MEKRENKMPFFELEEYIEKEYSLIFRILISRLNLDFPAKTYSKKGNSVFLGKMIKS